MSANQSRPSQAGWPTNALLTERASAIYNQLLHLLLTLSYVHYVLTEASPVTKPGSHRLSDTAL
jgi:hypothetical protein